MKKIHGKNPYERAWCTVKIEKISRQMVVKRFFFGVFTLWDEDTAILKLDQRGMKECLSYWCITEDKPLNLLKTHYKFAFLTAYCDNFQDYQSNIEERYLMKRQNVTEGINPLLMNSTVYADSYVSQAELESYLEKIRMLDSFVRFLFRYEKDFNARQESIFGELPASGNTNLEGLTTFLEELLDIAKKTQENTYYHQIIRSLHEDLQQQEEGVLEQNKEIEKNFIYQKNSFSVKPHEKRIPLIEYSRFEAMSFYLCPYRYMLEYVFGERPLFTTANQMKILYKNLLIAEIWKKFSGTKQERTVIAAAFIEIEELYGEYFFFLGESTRIDLKMQAKNYFFQSIYHENTMLVRNFADSHMMMCFNFNQALFEIEYEMQEHPSLEIRKFVGVKSEVSKYALHTIPKAAHDPNSKAIIDGIREGITGYLNGKNHENHRGPWCENCCAEEECRI